MTTQQESVVWSHVVDELERVASPDGYDAAQQLVDDVNVAYAQLAKAVGLDSELQLESAHHAKLLVIVDTQRKELISTLNSILSKELN